MNPLGEHLCASPKVDLSGEVHHSEAVWPKTQNESGSDGGPTARHLNQFRT